MAGEPKDLSDDELNLVSGGSGPDTKLEAAKHLSTDEDGFGTAGSGHMGGMTGIGSTVSQADMGTAASREKEMDAATAQAEASAGQSAAQDDQEFVKAYAENIKAVQDKLAAIQQAQVDTMRSITRG